MIPPGYTLIATAYAKLAAQTSPSEAWGIFRYLLITGRLGASIFETETHEVAIQKNRWQELSGNGLKEVFTTGTYDLDTDYMQYPEDTAYPESAGGKDNSHMILLRKGELDAVLREYEAASRDREVVDEQKKSKGGRPPKYVSFAVIVFKILHLARQSDFPTFDKLLKTALNDESDLNTESFDENTARMVAKPMYDVWRQVRKPG